VSAEPAWSLATATALAASRGPRDVAAILPEPIRLPGIHRKTTLTFGDLETVVARGAAGLRRSGVGRGDAVAVVVRSNLDGLLAAMAAARAGATPAFLYAGLPEIELQPLVNLVDADRVLGPGPEGLAAAMELAGPESLLPEGLAPDVAVVLYTSGTTGRPKGVPLRTEALASALRFARLRPDVTPGRDDRTVAALPLAHVMGLVLALAYLEARVPAVFLPRFTADGVLDAIEGTRASVFAGVPGIFRMMEAHADARDLSSVRLWVSGADAMPRDLARAFQHRGSSLALAGRKLSPAFFVDGYGLVEATGPALFRIMGPVGLMRKYRPLPGWRARAVAEDGEPVSPGESGTLELSGPGVFRGYVGEEPQDREWLRTQDLGTVSRLQGVEITGRSEHLMKVGGHRLHPGEIEEALLLHPAVEDAGVTGVAHPTMGQVPAAGVVLAAGATATGEELSAWVADKLARYKVPRTVQVIEEIPRTPTHKVRRNVLAELLNAEDSGASA
jgi:acyl-coenzyme A synthetase/AMP-(fatty) acid ligase